MNTYSTSKTFGHILIQGRCVQTFIWHCNSKGCDCEKVFEIQWPCKHDKHSFTHKYDTATMVPALAPLPHSWPVTSRRSAACLHGAMLSFKQHVVRTSRGPMMEFSTLAPNMRLSVHIRTTVACISMSRSMAGPLWGGQTWCLHRCVGPKLRGQTPQYPSGGPGPPLTGKDGAFFDSRFSPITGDMT